MASKLFCSNQTFSLSNRIFLIYYFGTIISYFYSYLQQDFVRAYWYWFGSLKFRMGKNSIYAGIVVKKGKKNVRCLSVG